MKNCKKPYALKNILLAHLRTHYNIKPFACPFCNKFFNEKGNLKTHIREQARKTPIPVEPQENLINQYNNNPPLSKYTPKNIKEEYNYGNEVPRTYEEYQKLIQKENERENLLKQRQIEQENINNLNTNNIDNIELTKSQEEEFRQS